MEEWRDVPGSGGKYQINISTKSGRCRSLDWKHSGKAKEFSNKPNKQGRLFWVLTIDKKEICLQAARWIAITFPELVQNEYFEGAVIDHVDTDPMNNLPSNLRWVTYSGNNRNPLTSKHMSASRKGKKGPHKPVRQYTSEGDFLKEYESAREACRLNPGFNYKLISLCCLGKRKSHYGFIWKYAE